MRELSEYCEKSGAAANIVGGGDSTDDGNRSMTSMQIAAAAQLARRRRADELQLDSDTEADGTDATCGVTLALTQESSAEEIDNSDGDDTEKTHSKTVAPEAVMKRKRATVCIDSDESE